MKKGGKKKGHGKDRKKIAKKIRQARSRSGIFSNIYGGSWGKYHTLALFLAISAGVALLAVQNSAQSRSVKQGSKHKNSGFNPVYLNDTSRAQVNHALSTPGYNLTSLLSMMHEFSNLLASPGELIFPINVRGNIEYRPFPFCQMPDRMQRRGSELKNYKNAKRWLHDRRNIDNMTSKQFVATLKMFNRKITGGKHDIHDFRNHIVWHNHDINGGLFDNENKLKDLLNNRFYAIAQEIRENVLYISHTMMTSPAEDQRAYYETVLMELYTGDLLKKVQQEGTPEDIKKLQERQLTGNQKKVVRKIYDIKEKVSPEEHAELYEQDFTAWKSEPLDDIVAKVGKLHYFILKRHGFSDGNGRSARGMTDEYLNQHGLPPVFYPSGDEYRKTASQAVQEDNPKILVDFFRKHIDARKYLETMRKAGDVQRECIEIPGGSEKCDPLLLGIMGRKGPGFC